MRDDVGIVAARKNVLGEDRIALAIVCSAPTEVVHLDAYLRTQAFPFARRTQPQLLAALQRHAGHARIHEIEPRNDIVN